MIPGRKPDPDAVRDAKGNPGKRRKPPTAALPAGPIGLIKPLAKLTPAAAAVWQAIGPELERMNFIRQTDREAFGRYCQTVVEYWEVTKKLRAEGVVYWTETLHGKMKRINPFFLVQDRLAGRLIALESVLGLNPASRQQIMLRLAGGLGGQAALPFAPHEPADPVTPEVGFLSAPAATTH